MEVIFSLLCVESYLFFHNFD